MPLTADQLLLAAAVESRMDEALEDAAAQPQGPLAAETLYEHAKRAASLVCRRAPARLLHPLATDENGETVLGATADGRGIRIELPAGTVQVLRLRLEPWTVALHTLTTPESPAYIAQGNVATRATASRPVAAYVPAPDSNSGTAVEAWPGGGVATLVVVQTPAPEALENELRDAMLWLAAAAALDHLREPSTVAQARADAALAPPTDA